MVRARVARKLERSVTLSDYDHLRGQPHDPTGTKRGVQVNRGDLFPPRRVFLTQEVVRKFGPTPDCRKCRGAVAW